MSVWERGELFPFLETGVWFISPTVQCLLSDSKSLINVIFLQVSHLLFFTSLLCFCTFASSLLVYFSSCPVIGHSVFIVRFFQTKSCVVTKMQVLPLIWVVCGSQILMWEDILWHRGLQGIPKKQWRRGPVAKSWNKVNCWRNTTWCCTSLVI